MTQQLTIEQIEQLNQISDPVARRRYGVLFQLPQDMQDAFVSENTTNSVWSITKEKYNLTDRKVSATARIIGLIFLGELPIKNFIVSLQRDLNVDVKTAQAIAQDINQAIFQPVRQSLMAVHGLTQTNADSTPINAENINGRGTTHIETRNNNVIQAEEPESRSGFPIKSGMTNKPQIQNDRRTVAEPRHQVQYQQSRQQTSQDDYEAKRRREEVLNKIKQPPARPAMFRIIPNKNIVDLRVLAKKKHYKKSEYNGFFSA
jgi:hypothetical protein